MVNSNPNRFRLLWAPIHSHHYLNFSFSHLICFLFCWLVAVNSGKQKPNLREKVYSNVVKNPFIFQERISREWACVRWTMSKVWSFKKWKNSTKSCSTKRPFLIPDLWEYIQRAPLREFFPARRWCVLVEPVCRLAEEECGIQTHSESEFQTHPDTSSRHILLDMVKCQCKIVLQSDLFYALC